MEDAATGIYLDAARGRVHRLEVWWRAVPAIKSGSNNPLCEVGCALSAAAASALTRVQEAMVLRSHVHDLTLMRKWSRNHERCRRMCACTDTPVAPLVGEAPWRVDSDLDYTHAQLRWIGRRKESELNRLRAVLSP